MAFIGKGGPTLTSSDLKFQGFPVRPLCVICRLPKLALESLDAANRTSCLKKLETPQNTPDILPIMQLEQQPVGSALLGRSRMIIFHHYLAFPLTAAGQSLPETLNEL